MADLEVESELAAQPKGVFVWLAFGALLVTAVGVALRIVHMVSGDESVAVGLLSLVFQVAFGLWLSRVFWRIAQRRAA